MIKELILQHHPRRFLVINKNKILMVTYDKRMADDIEAKLVENINKKQNEPSQQN